MKKLTRFIITLILCCISACAFASDVPEEFVSGDFEYILLPDGTAGITDFLDMSYTGGMFIPDSLDGYTVTSIEDNAFMGCRMHSIVIPDTVTRIGDFAFSYSDGITDITIPDSVTSVGINPFQYCLELTNISVSSDHPTLAVIDGVLFEKNEKKLICHPAGKADTVYNIPNGIRIIGSSAFYFCSNLTRISIPDSVISIEAQAFESCHSIDSIKIPGSVTHIGDHAFMSCSSLSSVMLNEGLESIGDGAFAYCGMLNDISIPVSVTHVGANPIFGYVQSTTVTLAPNHPTLAVIDGVLFNTAEKQLICATHEFNIAEYAIPAGVEVIGDNAFAGNEALTGVAIPDSITYIGKEAFYSTGLTSISIPGSVTSIGDGAFSDCNGLTSVVVPGNVHTIGSEAFAMCENLTDVTLEDGIVYIGDFAFSGTNISRITIPDSVTSIGVNPFAHCFSLWFINISDGNPAYAVADRLLYEKAEMKLVSYPGAAIAAFCQVPDGIRIIGEQSFGGCTRLTSVALPGSVTHIEENVFMNCTSLKSVTLSEGLTYIGKGAFDGRYGLTEITIPASVTTIDAGAFAGCDSLKTVTLSDGLERIGSAAFCYCSSLTSVTIPETVTFIGRGAFDDCPGLTLNVEAGSYAEQYAVDNELAYEYAQDLSWLND